MSTLSYSELSSGWPTYYSFEPEWMIGMNNNFYSFNQGNLIKHNEIYSADIYGAPIQVSLVFCANKTPLVNKLFKAISLDSSTPWSISLNIEWANLAGQPGGLTEDADGIGQIFDTQFIRKEGMWFSNISLVAPNSSSYRNITGMGVATVTTAGATSTYIFATPISSTIAIGDFYGYVITTSPTTMFYGVGTITTISTDRKTITTGNTLTAPLTGASNVFVFAAKNLNAESYGYLAPAPIISMGRFTVIQPGTNKTDELFSVEFDVMKSMP
jgi:hypothetical protein